VKATGNPIDRRLVFVVGKGGVGKSTVAAALALAAVQRKRRVLLVALDADDRMRSLFGTGELRGPTPVELQPGLFGMSVDGRSALEEYLRLIIPVRRVLSAIFESKVYQYFVAAAPGLRELMAVGKIFYEVDQRKWDLVVVDCPATGHALQYLRMPKTAYETFSSGLVHREAKRVWALLSDPAATAVSIVTTAEEMPTNETLEICRQLRSDLDLPEGWIFVNRFHAPDFSRQELATLDRDAARRQPPAARALCEHVAARAEEEVGWGELNEMYRQKLAVETDWRLVRLPFLFREEFGLADVEQLCRILLSEMDADASPVARARGTTR
jgi:anion-transporting  ArsA/GET3 family ATPase